MPNIIITVDRCPKMPFPENFFPKASLPIGAWKVSTRKAVRKRNKTNTIFVSVPKTLLQVWDTSTCGSSFPWVAAENKMPRKKLGTKNTAMPATHTQTLGQ